MLKEWAVLEQKKILDEQQRKKRNTKRESNEKSSFPLNTSENAELNKVMDQAVLIQAVLDDIHRLCSAHDRSLAAYSRGMHHLGKNAEQQDAQLASARRAEFRLKAELAQEEQQHGERVAQLLGDLQLRDARISALSDSVQELTRRLDALRAEHGRRDAGVADIVAAHAREVRARDTTIDALRQQAARLSTERAIANVAHEEAVKDLRLRLDQVPICVDLRIGVDWSDSILLSQSLTNKNSQPKSICFDCDFHSIAYISIPIPSRTSAPISHTCARSASH